MLSQDILIPVYFSKYNAELETVVNDLGKISEDGKGLKQSSALAEIIDSISANGYQVNNYDLHIYRGCCSPIVSIVHTFLLGSCYRRYSCT